MSLQAQSAQVDEKSASKLADMTGFLMMDNGLSTDGGFGEGDEDSNHFFSSFPLLSNPSMTPRVFGSLSTPEGEEQELQFRNLDNLSRPPSDLMNKPSLALDETSFEEDANAAQNTQLAIRYQSDKSITGTSSMAKKEKVSPATVKIGNNISPVNTVAAADSANLFARGNIQNAGTTLGFDKSPKPLPELQIQSENIKSEPSSRTSRTVSLHTPSSIATSTSATPKSINVSTRASSRQGRRGRKRMSPATSPDSTFGELVGDKGRNPWTPEEDKAILRLVEIHGIDKGWKFLCAAMPGRSAKQCSERWRNHLDPNVKKHTWSKMEDQVIIRTHRMMGPKWSAMAKLLPGRTDHAIKNRWYSTMRRVNRQFTSRKLSQKDMQQPLFRYCFTCLASGASSQNRSIQPISKRRKNNSESKWARLQHGRSFSAGVTSVERINMPPQDVKNQFPFNSTRFSCGSRRFGGSTSPMSTCSTSTRSPNAVDRVSSLANPMSPRREPKLDQMEEEKESSSVPSFCCRCGNQVFIEVQDPQSPLRSSRKPALDAEKVLRTLSEKRHIFSPYPLNFVIFDEKSTDRRRNEIAGLFFRVHLGTIPIQTCQLITAGASNGNFNFQGFKTLALFKKISPKSEKLTSACSFRVHQDKDGQSCVEMLLFACEPTAHYGYGRLLLSIMGLLSSKYRVGAILTCAAQQTTEFWSSVGFNYGGPYSKRWGSRICQLTGSLVLERHVKTNVAYHYRVISRTLLMLPPSIVDKDIGARDVITIPNIQYWIDDAKAQMSVKSSIFCGPCAMNNKC